jgi:hypothetical protein
MLHIIRLLFALPLSIVLAGVAAAPVESAPGAYDPPERAGRLSLIEGSVALRQAGASEWDEASENWPVTSGHRIHTTPGSRAEIRVGSSVVHLDGSSEIEIRQLADGPLHIWLDYGSLALRVRSPDPDAAMVIETRDGRARTGAPGHYRVSSAPGVSALSTYHGQLEFESDDSRVIVPEGQGVEVRFAGRTEYVWRSPERDDFFAWSLARDLRDDELGVPPYVSPEMTGAEELALHGDWQETADYGPVWYPRALPADWAPYRWGRWIWVEPWGWTWLDDAPWGFAPFHYGRWVHLHGSWAWVPGAYVARPVYAPALVVWIGSPGWQLGFSSGHRPALGWFPLAPHEVFVPTFPASPIFVQRVNITHVTRVTRIIEVTKAPHRVHFAHRHHRDAVTVVPVEEIRHGRRVDRHALRDARFAPQEVPVATVMPRPHRDADPQLRARAARIEEQRRQHLDDGVRTRVAPVFPRRGAAGTVPLHDDEAGRRARDDAGHEAATERRAVAPDRRDREAARGKLRLMPGPMPDGDERRIRETAPERAAEPPPALPRRGRHDDGERARQPHAPGEEGVARGRARVLPQPPSGGETAPSLPLRVAPGGRIELPGRVPQAAEHERVAPGGRIGLPGRVPQAADHEAFRPPRQEVRRAPERPAPALGVMPSPRPRNDAGADSGAARERSMRVMPRRGEAADVQPRRDAGNESRRDGGVGRHGFGGGAFGR